MSEKNEIKVRLSTVISIVIILILIVALGVVYYLGFVKEDINKETIANNSQKSQTQIKEENNTSTNELTTESKKETEDSKEKNVEKDEDNKEKDSNYLEKFSKSVSKELENANEICVDSTTGGNLGVTSVYVNSKGEASVRLEEDSKLYKKYGEYYKLADDVANVYDYKMGNGINEYIFLLKTDGSVDYIHLDMDSNKITIKNLKKVKDVTNIIQISGGDADGIGGYGVLFITTDGTCLPYFDM